LTDVFSRIDGVLHAEGVPLPAIAARVVAEAGWSERARLLLDQLRSAELDEESSYLLTLAQAGLAAVTLGDATHAQWIVELLLPWRELVAIDSEGMWPALPVAMVTRDLHTVLGDAARAREDHAIGRRVATRLRSAPAIQRLHTDGLAAPLERSAAAAASGPRSRSAHAPAVGVATSGGVRLDARQIGILNRLAGGATNEAIADELHVSRATAVRQISAIYRALGASNRAEAARRAAELGLLPQAVALPAADAYRELRRMQQPGTVFMAVGAGHLAGKGSVQALLAEKGLKVERVAY
jgi:DNA-binding CsgD family transcriptional regulator